MDVSQREVDVRYMRRIKNPFNIELRGQAIKRGRAFRYLGCRTESSLRMVPQVQVTFYVYISYIILMLQLFEVRNCY